MLSEHYLKLAQSLTNSNDIDVIIAAAAKIRAFDTEYSAIETPIWPETFREFIELEGTPPLAFHGHGDEFRASFVQKEMASLLDDDGKRYKIVHKLTRRIGWTEMLQRCALFDAMSGPNRNIVMMHPALRIAEDAMTRIFVLYDALESIGFTSMPKIIQKNKREITFENGSRIILRPMTADALRGHTIHALYMDMCAGISYSKVDDFWMSLLPCLDRFDARVVLSDEKMDREGLLYKLWNDGSDRFTRISISDINLKLH